MTTTRVSDDSGSSVDSKKRVGRSGDPTDVAADVIQQRLGQVRRRQTGVQLASGGLITAALFLAALMIAMIVDARLQLLSTTVRSGLTYATLSLAAFAFVWLVVRPLARRRTYVDVARDVECELPELEERWSSVESLSHSSDGEEVRGSAALIRQVAREAVDLEPLVQSEQLVSVRGLRRPAIVCTALLAVMSLALLIDFPRVSVLIRRFWSPSSPISFVQIEAMPGHTLVAVGEPLRIQATMSPRPVDTATIFIRAEDNTIESLDMRTAELQRDHKSDDDAEDRQATDDVSGHAFVHRIRKVKKSFEYRIRAGDGQTDWYRVTVAQRPRITDVRLRITPPRYTGRDVTAHEELPRHVRVVEGSTIHFALRADMPLSTARLRLGDADSINLAGDAEGWYHGELSATESIRLAPHAINEQGLANGRTATCRVTVFKDRAPSVELVAPDEDVSVRPDDTVNIEFKARDDYGITGAELIVRKVGGDANDPETVTTIPVPLGDEQGRDSVEQLVALDLSKFELEQGEQLEYAIRVYDSRNLSAESAQPRMAQSQTAANEGSTDPATTGSDREDSPTGESPPPQEVASNDTDPSAQPPGAAEPAPESDTPDPTAAQVADSEPPNANAPSGIPDPQPGKPADTSQANNSPSQSGQPNSQQTPAAPGEAKDAKGELAGAPRPSDEMTRRVLDVPQSTTSSSLRLTIDQWAGSFEGQARAKLQIAIQPYIDQLQQDLEQAQQHTTALTTTLSGTGRWTDAEVVTLDRAQDRLKSAIDAINELQARTAETPYAFVGLQLVDIGQAHVGPALARLLDEVDADRKATERYENVDQARHHIDRARELLDALLQQYEEVKRNERIAEQMQLVKTMYEVFVEDTFGMLRQQSESLNPKGRKIAEYELDQQFLDDLRAQLEKRRDLQAELARILAEDPRLLRRLMAIAAQRSSTLRDQMTRLAWRQEAVLEDFERWQSAEYLDPPRDRAIETASAEVDASNAEDDSQQNEDDEGDEGVNDDGADAVAADAKAKQAAELEVAKMRRILAVGDWDGLSREAAALHENFVTWSPLDLANSTRLDKAGDSARQIAAAASRVRDTAAAGRYEQTLKESQQLYATIERFEAELPQLVDEHPGHQGLLVHVTNRLAEANKIAALARAVYRKVQWMHRGRVHRVSEIDQQRVTAETSELASRLDGLDALLPPQVSDEVRELAKQLQATVNDELQVHQVSAIYALREARDNSTEKLQQSIDSFTKAEGLFDELIDKAIEELDQLPVGAPMVGEDPTLDELLAMLENELNENDPLGIPARPDNLQVWFDFMRPGGMMGMMAGAAAAGQASQTMTAAEKIQQSAQERGRALAKNNRSDETSDEVAVPTEVRWNTLVSQLEDGLRQGRGTLPPQQYRRAIEQYFKSIARRRQRTD